MANISTTDLANLALSKLGALAITNIGDTTVPSAVYLNTNFAPAFQECARGAPWNCLRRAAQLVQTVNAPTTWSSGSTYPSSVPVAYAPFTYYQVATTITFLGYLYTVNTAFTSTNNFNNDLTTGYLTQETPYSATWYGPGYGGSQYVSGWQYAYLLPADYILAVSLNDNWCWGEHGSGKYEVMQGPTASGGSATALFCNEAYVTLKYTANVTDTTQYDPLFVDTLSFLLASKVATPLRKDSGKMQQDMLEAYKAALSEARARNAGEQSRRPHDPTKHSRLLRARYVSTNG